VIYFDMTAEQAFDEHMQDCAGPVVQDPEHIAWSCFTCHSVIMVMRCEEAA
jgi:hypothetical protein